MFSSAGHKPHKEKRRDLVCAFSLLLCLLIPVPGLAADNLQRPSQLQTLINEALQNSPELKALGHRVSAYEYRIPQTRSLPDPMVSAGYQNEGFKRYTYGISKDAQWMFSASQTIPFPGKLSAKGEVAEKELEALSAGHNAAQLKMIARIKEIYFDLYAAHKGLGLLTERSALLTLVEEASIARYSAGRGMQQDVLMAQTEKYMLIEKEAMLRQKIEALTALLNSLLGRPAGTQLTIDNEMNITPFGYKLTELTAMSLDNSPEIRSKDKSVAAAEMKVSVAKRDYIPDLTVTGSYFRRGAEFDNMWSITTAINLPIFFFTKQRNAVSEAKAMLLEAQSDREVMRLLIESAIGDNLATLKASEKLMSLYKDGLIPKGIQDFELSLSGYKSGSSNALTVLTRLKAVIDYEIQYWTQFAEHEKAIARIESITGMARSAIKE